MGLSVATPSVAISRLEAKAGFKRRKRKKRYGDAYPIENKRKGGAKKSKRKGASFEKQVASLFGAYFGCSVRRTPGSGGWATVGDFGPRGDLVFAIRRAPYHVECKKHEGWELEDLITGKRSGDTTSTNSIERWWAQTIRDCPTKKFPMLIFARNGLRPLLMIRDNDLAALHQLGLKNSATEADLGQWQWIPRFQVWTDIDGCRSVMLLEEFFKFIRPPKCSPRRKTWQRGVG